jgi:hypothetical protein
MDWAAPGLEVSASPTHVGWVSLGVKHMSDAGPAYDPPSGARDRVSFAGYPWRRLVLSALFLAILSLVFWAVLFIAVVQFVLRVFDPDASADLATFGRRLGQYMAEMTAYAVFARENAPFPFSPFPHA